METKLVVFKGKEIRRALHADEWWFSVSDVVETLTDSTDPKQYIKKMRRRDPELNSYWGTICTPLEIKAPDGKIRETNCANTEIARKQDTQGFDENKTAARKGGRISGEAREKLETETGFRVVSSENYLTEPEGRKRLTRKKKRE